MPRRHVPAAVLVATLVPLVACREAPRASASDAGATPASSAASAASAEPAAGPKEGDPAPDVTLALQDGRRISLASLRGKQVVVYFYPRDSSPGCTTEAQELKARFAELTAAGIVVVGVSSQDARSHQAFRAQEDLPFDLAVDEDRAVARAFGVPARPGGLSARQTFLVGADGKLKKIWRVVTPQGHAAEVLAAARG